MILLALIIPILAFIFETYPRFINRKFGVDIWTHLLYLKEYHKQGGIPKKIESGFIVNGTYDYPPAFITILSKFPYHLVERYEFLFSPFFDLLHLILIFFISYTLTQNILISITTQILYTLTPIIIIENSSATPRSLGYSLLTIVFISLFMFSNTGGYYFLILSLVSGTFIFLSHRFTTQGFLFFSIAFTVLENNLIYLTVFFISLFSAIILSKGFYLKVLEGHIGNLIFWYKNINYRFSHQVKGNYEKHKTQDFIFRVYNEFLKFPPFVLAITNPWTLPALYFFFVVSTQNKVFYLMGFWILISYVLSLLTIWIPKLRFLGEGQRYLELSAFPSAFLSSIVLFDFLKTNVGSFVLIGYIVICFAAFITIVVIQIKAIIKEKLRSLTPSMEKMFSFIKEKYPQSKLLCIPHQITTNTIYHTDCKVFVNADYKSIDKISEVYPFLRRPVKEIMKTHKLDTILLNEEYATIEDLKLKSYKIVKQIDNFYLIKPQ